jgi:hypothetical protein
VWILGPPMRQKFRKFSQRIVGVNFTHLKHAFLLFEGRIPSQSEGLTKYLRLLNIFNAEGSGPVYRANGMLFFFFVSH